MAIAKADTGRALRACFTAIIDGVGECGEFADVGQIMADQSQH